MSDVAELKAVIIQQHLALGIAGKLLSEIATSRSTYADEATAAFSHVFNAAETVKNLVDREIAGTRPSRITPTRGGHPYVKEINCTCGRRRRADPGIPAQQAIDHCS